MTADPIPVEQVALKPCPFCGGEAVSARVDRLGRAFPHYRVFCRSCLGRTDDAETREQAIVAWNTRARTEADRSVREALEQCAAPYFWMADGFWPDASTPAHKETEILRRQRIARAALTGSNPAVNGSERHQEKSDG